MSRAKELLQVVESIQFDSMDFMADLLDVANQRGIDFAYDGNNNIFQIYIKDKKVATVEVKTGFDRFNSS